MALTSVSFCCSVVRLVGHFGVDFFIFLTVKTSYQEGSHAHMSTGNLKPRERRRGRQFKATVFCRCQLNSGPWGCDWLVCRAGLGLGEPASKRCSFGHKVARVTQGRQISLCQNTGEAGKGFSVFLTHGMALASQKT